MVLARGGARGAGALARFAVMAPARPVSHRQRQRLPLRKPRLRLLPPPLLLGGGGGSGCPCLSATSTSASLAAGRRRWWGGGTVVVDARPCLREGEFPPGRRGRPDFSPSTPPPQRRACAPCRSGAPPKCVMADRAETGVPALPMYRPLAPEKGSAGPRGRWRAGKAALMKSMGVDRQGGQWRDGGGPRCGRGPRLGRDACRGVEKWM